MNPTSAALSTYQAAPFPWFETIGLLAGLCLAVIAVVMLLRLARSQRNPLIERILAGGGSGLIGAGLLGSLYVFLFPPSHLDASGQLIGEMPPEFGFCSGLVWLGLIVALGLLVVKSARRVMAHFGKAAA